jgi:predicted GNAT family acetyltransferase
VTARPDSDPLDDIRVVDEPDENRFALWVGDEVAGFTTYVRNDDAYALMHTEVRREFEGQGLATRLIASTLDQLAAREVNVLPYCPFVRTFLSQHRDYLGLVADVDRKRFGLS